MSRLIATLVSRAAKEITLDVGELPANRNGHERVSPPYFLQYERRIFLIDPQNWRTDGTTITANYTEQTPDECPDVTTKPRYQQKDEAA